MSSSVQPFNSLPRKKTILAGMPNRQSSMQFFETRHTSHILVSKMLQVASETVKYPYSRICQSSLRLFRRTRPRSAPPRFFAPPQDGLQRVPPLSQRLCDQSACKTASIGRDLRSSVREW